MAGDKKKGSLARHTCVSKSQVGSGPAVQEETLLFGSNLNLALFAL